MRRKTTTLLIACFLLSTISVFALFFITHQPRFEYSSFTRRFSSPITNKNVVDVKYNSYYFAGATDDRIYLANVVAPLHLLEINYIQADTQHIKLSIKNIERYKFKSIKVKVDSQFFYICDGVMPGLFRGKNGEWVAEKYTYDSIFFAESIPISTSSYAIRSINSQTREYDLAKISRSKPHVNFNLNLLQKQVDGIFCVDGMLHQSDPNRLVYVYFYRNQFICMDSSLNLLYLGNTIDSVSRVKVKTDYIESENTLTMSAPPFTVNKKSCVSRECLYVNSNLRAKNENKQTNQETSVIDVYNIKNGQYLLSFYIKNYNSNALKDFLVVNSKLISLFDHYIVIYDLPNGAF